MTGETGRRRLAAAVAGALILAQAVTGGCARPAEPGGAVLYERFCASCHGPGGKGDGPVAAELKTRPSDLTTLAARSGGRFDEAAVMTVIDGRREVEAHGPRTMPVWGLAFERDLGDQLHTRYAALLRTRALADYLRSIQEEPEQDNAG